MTDDLPAPLSEKRARTAAPGARRPLSIAALLSEAWSRTHGFKWTAQLAFGLYTLVYLAVAICTAVLLYGTDFLSPGAEGSLGTSLLQYVLLSVVLTPLAAGLYLLGVRRASDAPAAARTIFGYYHRTWPLLLNTLLAQLLIGLGLVLLIAPGIYLWVCYLLATPLVADKNLGPWRALEVSRKAIGRHWFTVFGLVVILGLLNTAALLTLGIGLIWTLPLTLIALGILYRDLIGDGDFAAQDDADRSPAQL